MCLIASDTGYHANSRDTMFSRRIFNGGKQCMTNTLSPIFRVNSNPHQIHHRWLIQQAIFTGMRKSDNLPVRFRYNYHFRFIGQ